MNESSAPCSCRDGGCPWWVRVGTRSSRTWRDARWTHPSVDWLCLELESGYSRIGLAFRLLSKVPHRCVDLKHHPLLTKLSWSSGKERQGPTTYMLGWRFWRQLLSSEQQPWYNWWDAARTSDYIGEVLEIFR